MIRSLHCAQLVAVPAYNHAMTDVSGDQIDLLAWVDIAEALACPACRGALQASGEELLSCETCGATGKLRGEVIDFLSDEDHLVGALGARFDLREDERVAAALASDPGRADRSLSLLSEELMGITLQTLPPHAQRGRVRYAKWFASIQPDVGVGPGLGILTKVDAAAGLGCPPRRGKYALEAGSGPGFHAPGFAQRFETIILVDCSLANLELAKRICLRTGTDRVAMVRADVEHLPIRQATMDFVHENGVIEHVAKPERMITEALRVLSPSGTFVCLSPNRYPLTSEPHFRLPLFGIVPRPLRRHLVPRRSGHLSETGTDLLSLRELKRCFRAAGADPHVFFLPPRLQSTVRKTLIRRIVLSGIARSPLRELILFVANRLLLPVAPYHFAVVDRRVADGHRSDLPPAPV